MKKAKAKAKTKPKKNGVATHSCGRFPDGINNSSNGTRSPAFAQHGKEKKDGKKQAG